MRIPSRSLRVLKVAALPGRPTHGRLLAGSLVLPCRLGAGGLRCAKREGDGATPVGRFVILSCFFRPGRMPRPRALLPVWPTLARDGWCDDPTSPAYNRRIRLPASAGHETMWRDDRLYDVGLVIDANVTRPRKAKGSAIFVHLVAEPGRPTAGCVALRPADLRRLLPRLGRGCALMIG